MRIAMLAMYVRGADGVGHHQTDWLRMLRDQGHQVTLYVESMGDGVPADMRDAIVVVDGATIMRSPHLAAMRRADLVICDYPAYYALADVVRMLNGPPILFTYHGVTTPDRWTNDDARQYLTMSRRRAGLVHFCQFATARSAWTREELHALTGYARERVVLLPVVVPAPPPREPNAPTPTILHVGRVAGHKRIDLLVDVLPLVRRAIPEARLALVGDASGPEYAPVADLIRHRAAALGVADAVTFHGSVAPARLEQIYGQAAVVASTSEHEGFCIPLVEAMARAVPTVVTATAALPETVGDAGLVVPPDDPEVLAAALVRAMTDQTLRATMIARGRARAHACEIEQVGEQLAALVALTAAEPNRTDPRPRLRQLLDVDALRAEAETATTPAPTPRSAISRVTARVRAWFQSDLRRQLDELERRQVAYNRRIVDALDRLDEWSADEGERQAAARRDGA